MHGALFSGKQSGGSVEHCDLRGNGQGANSNRANNPKHGT